MIFGIYFEMRPCVFNDRVDFSCQKSLGSSSNLFYFLHQGFPRISFLESISLKIEDKQSHLDRTIIFKDFMSYVICDVLEIPWQDIHKS